MPVTLRSKGLLPAQGTRSRPSPAPAEGTASAPPTAWPHSHWPARRRSLFLLASAVQELSRDWPRAPPLPSVTAGTAPRAAVGRSGDTVTSAPGGGAIGGRGVTRDVARAAPGRERGPPERPRREGRAAGAERTDSEVSGDWGQPSAATCPQHCPQPCPQPCPGAPGALCPRLDSSVPERRGAPGAGLSGDKEGREGTGASLRNKG